MRTVQVKDMIIVIGIGILIMKVLSMLIAQIEGASSAPIIGSYITFMNSAWYLWPISLFIVSYYTFQGAYKLWVALGIAAVSVIVVALGGGIVL